jgi:phosphatidate cytidylyltransferase
MLSHRVITAAILIPLLVTALFVLASWQLALVLGALIAVAAWEWGVLSGLRSAGPRLAYAGGLVAAGGVPVITSIGVVPAMLAALAWWLWSVYELTRFAGSADTRARSLLHNLVAGVVVLVPAWFALVQLHADDPRSPAGLLYLLVLVWTADTAAYFTGRSIGRTPLSPRISPNKTVEGLAGGLAGCVGVALAAGWWIWGFRGDDLLAWVLLAAVVGLFSVLGDLYESLMKRAAGVKDSGHWLPGHGGILDRCDSLTAAAPVFLLGWWLFVHGG